VVNAPATGRELRDAQLGLFAVSHATLLETCRALAVVIARRQGHVSINDIREQIDLPPGVHPSTLGAVFRTRQFRAIGYVEALHPAAHARAVRVYTLKEHDDGQ